MIGPSSTSSTFYRPLSPRTALMPNLTPQAPVAPNTEFNGFQPTWQALPPAKESFTSPAGYPITKYTLPNGHRLFVEQRPTNAIGVRTFVNAGPIIENAVHPSRLYSNTGLPSGIAHLDEHCHFLASEHFPVKNTLNKAMDSLGSRHNATTSDEKIQHELFFNREDLSNALKLHVESVLRPIYNPVDINQEKANVLNEMAMRLRPPDMKIYDKLGELLFDRPYRQIGGSREDVLRATPEHFQQFRNLAYAPTNLITVVSGNVSPEEVLSILSPEFGANPPRYSPAGSMAMRLALQPGEVRSATIIDPQLSGSQIMLGFPAPPSTNLKERIAMEFLDEILCSDSMSLLQDQIVNRQHLANHIGTVFTPFKQTGMFRVNIHTTPGQEQRALTGTLHALNQVSQGLIPDYKIAQIRERLVRNFLERQNNIGSITQQLGEEAINNTLPYYLNYVQLANLITAEDLQAVAQKYLNPNRYAVVFGKPPTGPVNPSAGGFKP